MKWVVKVLLVGSVLVALIGGVAAYWLGWGLAVRWGVPKIEPPRLDWHAVAAPIGAPGRIKVGPYYYTVAFIPKHNLPDNMLAADSFADQMILIPADVNSGFQRAAMMHELFHVCRDVGSRWGNDKTQDEEAFIESVAPLLVLTLQENPKLTAWLAREEADGR